MGFVRRPLRSSGRSGVLVEVESESGEYRSALKTLFAARRHGMVLGAERVARALVALGDPHLSIETRVVVGGTNGKGSTSAFLEAIACAEGKRVGVFSSPHLSSFVERFRVGGRSVAEQAVTDACARILVLNETLTFFEQCTVIAALVFEASDVELGIFEVGLGGRLDSTRALVAGHVLITGVALDHQEILGHNLPAIAREKLGVAWSGNKVVVGFSGAQGSQAALVAAAREQQVPLSRIVDDRDVAVVPANLGLLGPHQRENAAAASAMAEELNYAPECITRGLAEARLPGRFETISQAPWVVVDGAHNGHGARALARALTAEPLTARGRRLGIVAVSRDKDVAAIVLPLLDELDEIWVSAATSERAIPAAELVETIGQLTFARPGPNVPLRAFANAEQAVQGLRHKVDADQIVVFGSLVFVGQFRAEFLGPKRVPTDPILLTDPR